MIPKMSPEIAIPTEIRVAISMNNSIVIYILFATNAANRPRNFFAHGSSRIYCLLQQVAEIRENGKGSGVIYK